jgi:hypothetical protein
VPGRQSSTRGSLAVSVEPPTAKALADLTSKLAAQHEAMAASVRAALRGMEAAKLDTAQVKRMNETIARLTKAASPPSITLGDRVLAATRLSESATRGWKPPDPTLLGAALDATGLARASEKVLAAIKPIANLRTADLGPFFEVAIDETFALAESEPLTEPTVEALRQRARALSRSERLALADSLATLVAYLLYDLAQRLGWERLEEASRLVPVIAALLVIHAIYVERVVD